jgi:hypothetical protein
VLVAREHHDVIVTGDPSDLRRLDPRAVIAIRSPPSARLARTVLYVALMKPTISAIVLVLPMSVSLPAAAQTERAPESRDSSTQSVSAAAHVLVTSGEDALGGTVGVTALGRYEWLTAGLIAETGLAAMEYEYRAWAATVGATAEAGSFELKLLGVGGWHSYDRTAIPDSGRPAVSANLAFLGARLVGSYLFFDGPAHLELGAALVYENDLGRERVTATNTQTGGPDEVEVGDGRLGAGLVLGGVFDL